MQPEKTCLNCKQKRPRTDGEDGFHCKYLGHDYSSNGTDPCSRYKLKKVKSINPKSKEKTMIKRIRHLMRVIAILWCGYGLYLLGCISNPLIYKLWHLAPLPWDTEISQPGNVILPWLLTIAVIIAVIIISFVLHNFTKWFFGDK